MNWEHVLISFVVSFCLVGTAMFLTYPKDDENIWKAVCSTVFFMVCVFGFTAAYYYRQTLNG